MSERKKGPRFAAIPARAIADKAISNSQLRTLAALGLHTDMDGWCWPTLKKLGEHLGKSAQAVSKDIQALKEAGYVNVHHRKRPDGSQTSNKYQVKLDYPPQPHVEGPQPPEVEQTPHRNKTKEKDSSADADAPPVKEKTEYILRSEAMEEAFAKALGVPTPDWEKQPAAANKRWRLPLNRMLKETIRFGLPDRMVLTGIKSCVRQMRADKLTFDAPDQIEKVFGAWLVNRRNGEGGPAYASRNLSAEYREKAE